ncbi:hypothetical protein HDU97_008900 [Phlyctochytrium planicorne]|nr:hypothetical protein HDU97_008900 [Phlyctochytrium planicorne]
MDHVLALFCAIAIRGMYRFLATHIKFLLDSLNSAALAEFSIGVSCGTAFTGIIGNSGRSDFNLFGRTINLAARYMTLPLAKKSIACHLESIQQKVIEGGGFEFGKITLVKVKGVLKDLEVGILNLGTKDPLRAGRPSISESFGYRPVSFLKNGDGNEKEFEEEIVGRSKEIEQINRKISRWLDRSIEDAASHEKTGSSHAACIILLGKSGVGKTTLDIDHVRACRAHIDAFVEQSSLRGGHFLTARFNQASSMRSNELDINQDHQADGGIPYVPETITRGLGRLSSVKNSLRESMTTVGTGTLCSKVVLQIDNASLDFEERNRVESAFIEILECLGFSKKWMGHSIIEEILGFLGVNKENVDNIQWIDVDSFTSLKAILKAPLDKFMMIYLSRPMKELKENLIASDLAEILQMPNTLVLTLNTMDEHGTRQMIFKHLGVEPSSSLIQEILRNSGGIPMVIEILATGLKAPGMIRVMGGLARLADGVILKADEKDIGSIISSQFDLLSLRFQMILRVASISGINFSVSQVVEICNSIQLEFKASQDSLMTQAMADQILTNEDVYEFLLHPEMSDEEAPKTYTFRHIYIQKGIKSMILTDLRKLIHLKLFSHYDLAVRGKSNVLCAIDPTPGENRYGSTTYGVVLAEGYRHLEECFKLMEERLSANSKVVRPDLQVLVIRMEYLGRLVDFFWSKQNYGEAMVYLEKMFEFWESIWGEQTEDLRSLEFKLLVDRLAMAKYCSWKIFCLRALSRLQLSYDANLMAFAHLDHPFPKTPKECIKYAFGSIKDILLLNKKMRKVLEKAKKTKEILNIVVDFTPQVTKDSILNDLLTWMIGNGVLVGKEIESLLASIKLATRTGNIFTDGLTDAKVLSMMYTDQFRVAVCGKQTASSISHLVLNFAESFVGSSSIRFSEPIQFLEAPVLKRREEEEEDGNDKLERELLQKHPSDERGLIPLHFDYIGPVPQIYSMEAGHLTFGAGFVSRSRDLFRTTEVYLRLTLIILAEVKGDMSYVGIVTYAYYRELMSFSGKSEIALTLVNRVIYGQQDQRTFRPYLWADALQYSIDLLAMTMATRRDKQYFHELDMKGFEEDEEYVKTRDPVEPTAETKEAGAAAEPYNTFMGSKRSVASSVGRVEPASQRLPPFLERDAHVPLVNFRIIRLALAFENIFRVVKSLADLDKMYGSGLEKCVGVVDELLAKTTQVGPNIRFIIMDKMLTGWRLWGILGELRMRWIGLMTSLEESGKGEERKVDPWRQASCSKYCNKWSKLMTEVVKRTGSYLFAMVQPSFTATSMLVKPNFKKAAGFWRLSVKAIKDLAAGKVKNKYRVGLFCEPLEWRGLEHFAFHVDVLEQRIAVVEALGFVDSLLEFRIKQSVNPGKVRPTLCFVPGDREQEFVERVRALEMAIRKLESYGASSSMELLLPRTMLGFVLDMKRL